MSIYDVMVLDALGGAAAFGLAILLGVIGLGKGLGGVVLCGAAAAGVLACWHLTGDSPVEDRRVDRSRLSPRQFIDDLQAALESNPGDIALSGMIIAFKLAYELGGEPPESPEEMLVRLNYGRIATANSPDICIHPKDVENARRYYLAVHWVGGSNDAMRPGSVVTLVAVGRVASKPERREGVVTFGFQAEVTRRPGALAVREAPRYDVEVSGHAAEACLDRLDVGHQVTVRGVVETNEQQQKACGAAAFHEEAQERSVVARPLHFRASEVTIHH